MTIFILVTLCVTTETLFYSMRPRGIQKTLFINLSKQGPYLTTAKPHQNSHLQTHIQLLQFNQSHLFSRMFSVSQTQAFSLNKYKTLSPMNSMHVPSHATQPCMRLY